MAQDGRRWPKISIVTPSYNQGRFLEEAICSVLDQGYPNLEYIIIDGGSTDESVEIIRKFEKHLAYWVSERDQGHYDAINKGFAHATGEIMAWLNSDDKYTPWAFRVVAEIVTTLPQVQWLTSKFPLAWNRTGEAVVCTELPGFARDGFYRAETLASGDWFATGWIQQESTFWKRTLWQTAGAHVATDLKLASDFELWARFFEHADLYAVRTPLGGFRKHGDQRSVVAFGNYMDEALGVLKRYGSGPCGPVETWVRRRIGRYSPGPLKPLVRWLGLIRHVPLCYYRFEDDRWTTNQ